MITVYHNNRCSKSREGLKLVEASNKPFQIINYLENPPTETELKHILKLLNLTPIQLVRKNEAIWKTEFKGQTLNDDQIITAMANNPKLIERPIVINGKKAVIGRPPVSISKII